MLSSMRKSAGSWMIKILLGMIVLAFVFMGLGSYWTGRRNTVANVNGEPISFSDYQQTYQRMMQNLEQRFGNKLDQDMIDMLNLKEQALDRLIEKRLLMQVAEKNDIRLPDDVLARSITSLQVFQNNGQFDPELYRRVLNQNRLSPGSFETLQKEAILTSMLKNFVSNAIPVSEAEARAWYKWQNTEVKIDYAEFARQDFADVTVTKQEVGKYFEEHKKDYKTRPKVKARYIRFSPEDYRGEVKISEPAIRDYYQSHQSEFTSEETVTARHILLKMPRDAEEKTVAQTRKKAMEIYNKARSGRDFAELAQKFSEGPSAAEGGYLGTLKKDDTVKPFAEKAFSMEAGDISKPVRTRFGFHIIKVEKHMQASVKPLEAVKEKIRDKLAIQRARDIAYDKALSVYDISFGGDDLVKNAKDMGLGLKTTGFFTQSRGPEDMENAGKFAKTAFSLPLKTISEVKEIGDAFFLIQPVEKQASHVPELASVSEKVRRDLKREKQKQAAKQAARNFLEQARQSGDFSAAAKAAEVKVQTTDFFKHGQPVPDIGQSRKLSSAAFSLSAENPLPDAPVAKGDTFYAIHLKEKKHPGATEFQAKKEETISQLASRKRQQTVNKWVAALRQQSDIETSDRFSDYSR
ncbi:MAG: SurA N-terminal domain-containing protein [Desulfobacteraceae bacterium]|nr:SurA N-terminal domain-containing protein [Desulfobacteraceae bacterium]